MSGETRTDEGARFRLRNMNRGRYDVYAVIGNKDRKCGTIDCSDRDRARRFGLGR